jgi:membrane associated rhomboid family serine protease
MGIYDREYYRDETGGSGWLSGAAPAVKGLIFLNVVVFIAQAVYPDLTQMLAAQTDLIFRKFQIWRLLTAAFVHDPHDAFHLLWNMLWLWFMGQEMESMYGSREFTRMYLTAAVVSTLIWALCEVMVPGSRLQPGARPFMMGASGAVNAVVVLYALYYPRREFLLFFLLPVPVWVLVVIYLGFDALQLLQKLQGAPGASMGIAVAAHLGGALYGYLYKRFDLRWSRLNLKLVTPRRPRLRIVKPESYVRERERDRDASDVEWGRTTAPTRTAPSVSRTEEQLDARLDEVLAKIAREGRGGLTDEDNRILQEASRRARGRRSDRV